MAAAGAALAIRPSRALAPSPPPFGGLAARLAAIEAETGGRLGVAVLDTGSGARAGHRSGERFPLCSTFKVLAASAVLARVDAGSENIDRLVKIAAGDLVPYSPVTAEHVGDGGMSLAELCEAAITRSDNTAGNLLLAAVGGPEGLTAYLRSLDDPATRLDRTEPTLNEALPDDLRDTTTPDAMLDTLHRLVLGKALSKASRRRLAGWMLANTTGGTRLRAGLPAEWRIGDKTGTGERGTTNDVGILWPPGREPVIAAVYLTGATVPPEGRNAAIAGVARVLAAALSR